MWWRSQFGPKGKIAYLKMFFSVYCYLSSVGSYTLIILLYDCFIVL